MEYLWFIAFDFAWNAEQQRHVFERCRVAPRFPLPYAITTANVLCPLPETVIQESHHLIDLLDAAHTAGFALLCRYVDTLATLHSLPIAPLRLQYSDGTAMSDDELANAAVLAHG